MVFQKLNNTIINERIEKVREAIVRGASSISEIKRKTGLQSASLYRFEREGKIKLPRGKAGRPIKIDEKASREALEKKENSLEKLCKIGNFNSPAQMWIHLNKYRLLWPENPIPYRTWPEVDEKIDRGESLPKIADAVSCSGEYIRCYINGSGQYNQWIEKRKLIATTGRFSNKEEKIKLQNRFLSTFRARIEELAREEDWATQKAVEYLHSLKVRSEKNYSFDLLYSIFKKYEEAQKKGEKLTLEELGEEVGFITPQVSRILARVGLEPLYGGKVRAKKAKIDAVKRGFGLDLSTEDVGYFLEYRSNNVGEMFRHIGSRGKTRFEIDKLGREYLTNRLASQIYEAQDASLNEDETAEYFGVSYDIVEYALAIRHEGIEKKLIKNLRILFNDKGVKTPYVTKKMREKLAESAL